MFYVDADFISHIVQTEHLRVETIELKKFLLYIPHSSDRTEEELKTLPYKFLTLYPT